MKSIDMHKLEDKLKDLKKAKKEIKKKNKAIKNAEKDFDSKVHDIETKLEKFEKENENIKNNLINLKINSENAEHLSKKNTERLNDLANDIQLNADASTTIVNNTWSYEAHMKEILIERSKDREKIQELKSELLSLEHTIREASFENSQLKSSSPKQNNFKKKILEKDSQIKYNDDFMVNEYPYANDYHRKKQKSTYTHTDKYNRHHNERSPRNYENKKNKIFHYEQERHSIHGDMNMDSMAMRIDGQPEIDFELVKKSNHTYNLSLIHI